jgi:hypothetical protein
MINFIHTFDLELLDALKFYWESLLVSEQFNKTYYINVPKLKEKTRNNRSNEENKYDLVHSYNYQYVQISESYYNNISKHILKIQKLWAPDK